MNILKARLSETVSRAHKPTGHGTGEFTVDTVGTTLSPSLVLVDAFNGRCGDCGGSMSHSARGAFALDFERFREMVRSEVQASRAHEIWCLRSKSEGRGNERVRLGPSVTQCGRRPTYNRAMTSLCAMTSRSLRVSYFVEPRSHLLHQERSPVEILFSDAASPVLSPVSSSDGRRGSGSTRQPRAMRMRMRLNQLPSREAVCSTRRLCWNFIPR
jgi:hypothetical protein